MRSEAKAKLGAFFKSKKSGSSSAQAQDSQNQVQLQQSHSPGPIQIQAQSQSQNQPQSQSQSMSHSQGSAQPPSRPNAPKPTVKRRGTISGPSEGTPSNSISIKQEIDLSGSGSQTPPTRMAGLSIFRDKTDLTLPRHVQEEDASSDGPVFRDGMRRIYDWSQDVSSSFKKISKQIKNVAETEKALVNTKIEMMSKILTLIAPLLANPPSSLYKTALSQAGLSQLTASDDGFSSSDLIPSLSALITSMIEVERRRLITVTIFHPKSILFFSKYLLTFFNRPSKQFSVCVIL